MALVSGGAMMEQGQLGSMVPVPTITERLRARRDSLRKDLDAVEGALAALEGNDEVAKVVDAISRIGHF